MKKIFVVMLMVFVLLAAGCDDTQADKQGQIESEDGIQLVQLPWLPEDKWRDGEQGADDEAWRFEPAGAWYYNDTDYLVYGYSCTHAGWQSMVFRVVNGSEPEQVCVWPEDSLYGYSDYLSSYYLAESQKLVLYNERQHTFLVYDNMAEQAEEFSVPASANLAVDDQAFWLDDGRYLFCRIEQDPKDWHITHFVSLYDEKTGAEVRLAEMSCTWCIFMPPTVQKPDRWLLLGSDGGNLLEVTLPAEGEAQVQQRLAYEEWPPIVPYAVYGRMRPVQNAAGDYALLTMARDDGRHYQMIDLAGGVLGECIAADNNGGGLLAAYGDTIYFSEHFAGENRDACRVQAYNYADNSSKIIFGTYTDGLAEEYPDLWNFECGAISPNGERLLMLADDYVLSLPLEK